MRRNLTEKRPRPAGLDKPADTDMCCIGEQSATSQRRPTCQTSPSGPWPDPRRTGPAQTALGRAGWTEEHRNDCHDL